MILQKETLEISIDRKAITNLKNISFIFEKERFRLREFDFQFGKTVPFMDLENVLTA